MNLLLFSDSHGNLPRLRQMIKQAWQEGAPDAILYAGDGIRDLAGLEADCPVYAVRGNCDLASPAPDQLLIPYGSGHVYLCHGHLHRVKRGLTLLCAAAQASGAAVAVFGHTHQQGFAIEQGVYCINPGALDTGQYARLGFSLDGRPAPRFYSL